MDNPSHERLLVTDGASDNQRRIQRLVAFSAEAYRWPVQVIDHPFLDTPLILPDIWN
jgi:hypothetical protein